MRAVSLNFFWRGFNQLCFVAFFHLDGLRLFHCTVSVSRYSVTVVIDDLSLREAMATFEQSWMSHFWVSESIQADYPFWNGAPESYVKTIGCQSRPFRRYRHNNNALVSTHHIFRDIFQQLYSENEEVIRKVLAHRAVWMSNYLYEKDVASAHEVAKGYTRPFDVTFPVSPPDSLREGYKDLVAVRKINKILRSEAISERAPNI